MLLTATLGGASWGLICTIISLILLFIAAFVVDGAGSRPIVRIHFLSAGMFFFVLAVALGGS